MYFNTQVQPLLMTYLVSNNPVVLSEKNILTKMSKQSNYH